MRYPFRLGISYIDIVTTLPPKKVVGADATFLEGRRLSLQRFLTMVSNHSVLSNDEYVVQFFKFRETIAVFKSSRTVLTDEESNSLVLTAEMQSQIPEDFDEKLALLRTSIQAQCEKFNQISYLMEKYLRRLEGIPFSDKIPAKMHFYLELSSRTPIPPTIA